MKNNETMTKILSGVAGLAAIMMIACVKWIAPVCTGMLELTSGKQVFMKCHYTATATVFFGVLMLVAAIVAFVKKEAVSCGIMIAALSCATYAIFNGTIGIGICMKPEMACHGTAPLVNVCATVALIAGIILIFSGRKIEK